MYFQGKQLLVFGGGPLSKWFPPQRKQFGNKWRLKASWSHAVDHRVDGFVGVNGRDKILSWRSSTGAPARTYQHPQVLRPYIGLINHWFPLIRRYSTIISGGVGRPAVKLSYLTQLRGKLVAEMGGITGAMNHASHESWGFLLIGNRSKIGTGVCSNSGYAFCKMDL